jgi:hypothetical protein
LVLDSFREHLVESVKNRFNEKQTNIAIIPDGLTSKLQPLDVAINKSFKAKLCYYYNKWINFKIHELTPAGRIKRPSYATVAKWVKKSWDEVDVSLIRRSFKCCRISIARDGSEDNLMFDYDSLLNNIKKKKSGHDKVRDINDFSSDSDDDSYRNSDSSDSDDSDSDSGDNNNKKSDSDEFDINEYEEQEASDYENEY